MAEKTPTPFGRYELVERIAMGGMAEVFKARTVGGEGFSKDVCIKRILPQFCQEEDFIRMFIDEAMLAARLQHANIVQIFDFDAVDGAYYIAMEYVAGRDLRAVIKHSVQAQQPLGPFRAAAICAEMCKGLHYAHQKDGMQLVHRDVSPHNVLVSMSGEVKVMDFGIAKATDRISRTSTGIIKGKIAYMAPEQAAGGGIDHRIDQFATGLVFYEMLTGKRAYDGSEPTALRRALNGEVEPPSLSAPDLPPEIDEIFLRCTARDPSARYPDMRAMERALTAFVYRRAPDDNELDLAAFMESLFGRAARLPTAVLPRTPDAESGRHAAKTPSRPSLGSVPVLTGSAFSSIDPGAATSRSDPGKVLDEGGDVFARPGAGADNETRTHMSSPSAAPEPAPAAPGKRGSPTMWMAALAGALVVFGGGGAWLFMSSPPVTEAVRPPLAVAPIAAPLVAAPPPVEPRPVPDVDPEKAEPPEPKSEAAAKEPANEASASVDVKGAGKVRFVNAGVWATVTERGRVILAETPGVVEMPAGRHTFVFRNPAIANPKRLTVDVLPDKTVEVRCPLRPGR